MIPKTSNKSILSGNKIFVPNYQRAYSWDTDLSSKVSTAHVNTFLSDLEDYVRSKSKSNFYFGHFLFEKKEEHLYGVIDYHNFLICPLQ